MSAEGGSIRILVVDDHSLVREGIGRLQREFPAFVSPGSEICWLAAGRACMRTALQTMWGKAVVVVRIRAQRVFLWGTVLANLSPTAVPHALSLDRNRRISRAICTYRARCFHVPRSLLLCVLSLWLTLSAAQALDPNKRLTQYGHTAWRIQDGFFNGAPYSIAQTADSYLWIGGASGLVRFDGVRFVRWTPPPGKQLSSSVVHRLLAARDGSLWIGTMHGLAHWNNQDLINYSSGPKGVIAPSVEDEDGTIWLLRAGAADETGPLCQVKGIDIRCYGRADGIPQEPYSSLVRDSTGNFWLGGCHSLTRW